MQFRENTSIDLITVSSIGVRITPINRQPVHTSRLFEMQSTSAETNVLNVSAALGKRTKVLTRFVQDSAIAAFIRSDLRRRNIAFEGPEIPQGGAWGYRHQFNIADSGFGVRGPRVLNDRAGEVGRTIRAEDFDLARIFEREGCGVLHLSGLFAALSEETEQTCLRVAEAAKAAGTRFSFDLNYRASFWKGREAELRASFRKLASMADILIGNEEDFQLALGVEGPAAGGRDISAKLDAFKGMIEVAAKEFPGARVFATTLREVRNANCHNWGAIMLAEGQWYAEAPREIQVYDRIGGGDGFVAGLLYAMLRGWESEKWLQFGWATGALAAASAEDYATPADEEQVWSIYQGNARVKR